MGTSDQAQAKKITSLSLDFYQQEDVVNIARDLIGKSIFTQFEGKLTGGVIIETEAYKGPEDLASHAYNNRRTLRTEVMYHAGGIAYVYICYGIHCLLNVVTNRIGIPHAVLIRALYPTHGIEFMQERRKKLSALCLGPGTLTQALGVTRLHNGISLMHAPLWIEDTGFAIDRNLIIATPRIGIAYAKEHALLPWRFVYKI
jgi:DNA-3-methyladenine glycosylase